MSLEMFADGFEQATILGTGPDGLTRVIVRSSWSERESILWKPPKQSAWCFVDGQSFTRRRSGFHGVALPLARIR